MIAPFGWTATGRSFDGAEYAATRLGMRYDVVAAMPTRGAMRWRPWLEAGVSHGSGDDDSTDSTHHTFFQMLPTARIYARTPFYNMMNTHDVFAILGAKPHASVTVRADFHALRLSNPRDLWYLGGGAFQPWSFGFIGRNATGVRSLANLWDLSADWAANKQVALIAYFGYVNGRAALRAIYPQRADGRFGYLEMNYRF